MLKNKLNFRCILVIFCKTAISFFFAGIFCIGWVAMAIVVLTSNVPMIIKIICWLSAPVITAAGFSLGTWCFERLPGTRKSSFHNILKWSVIGCAIGAAPLAIFAPMLIVFGMLFAGTISIVIREIVMIGK